MRDTSKESLGTMYKVTWFDYVKQETITEVIPNEHLLWLKEQKHIEVEKVEEA